MKIVAFTAENVKKLTLVNIRPDGSLVQITGPNGSGKSSVLDAIYYALGGEKHIPTEPVRRGAKKGHVRLDLGDMIVTRRFTAGGGSSLTVEAQDGARYPSPQRLLDKLLGYLTFDPLEFVRMTTAAQLSTLRHMVVLDADIDEMAAANAEDYARRRDINRDAMSLRQAAGTIIVPEGAGELESVDVADLVQQVCDAEANNRTLEQRRHRRQQVSNSIAEQRMVAAAERQEVDRLRAQIAEHEERARLAEENADEDQARLDAAEPLPEPIETAQLVTQIALAETINTAVRKYQERADAEKRAEAAEAEAQALTDAMEERTAKRTEAIKRARMPVEGLSFDDGQVLFEGLPFAQASSAQQLRVSVGIAMAANPTLRVLRVKDGSLLDENGLAMLAEMADADDYQIWIERVDTSGAVGIVMEDGHVRGEEGEQSDGT